MKGNLRCIDGRLFRHDPQWDDPDLETDVGQCPECQGKGFGTWCDTPQCSTCKGVGSLNPLTAPPHILCLSTMTCDDCGGTGYE